MGSNMLYSKYANIQLRRNIIYGTKLFGCISRVFYPREISTIRADKDRIEYESTPRFTGKLLINSIYKSKMDNLSSFQFNVSMEDDFIWSIEEFPIGCLISLVLDTGVCNYQIENINKTSDDAQVYYFKYYLSPYTLENRMINDFKNVMLDTNVFNGSFGDSIGNPGYSDADNPSASPTNLELDDDSKVKLDSDVNLGSHEVQNRPLFYKKLG